MADNIFNLPSGKVQNETKNVLQQIANTLGVSIDTLSRMSNIEQLVSSVIDGDITNVLNNELVATNIANKLNAKEIEYAPRLTSAEVQVNHSEKNISRSTRTLGDYLQPIVSFITDDGMDTDYQVLKPISEMYNIPFSMALVPSRDNQITDEHLVDALNMGWDFGAHTLTHPDLTQIPDEQINYELSESKRLVQKRGLLCNYVVYPFNAHGTSARKIARKHFKFAVAAGDRINQYPVQTYALGRIAFPAVDLTNNDNLDFYKQFVDTAIANKQWVVFMLHATFLTETQQQRLKDLIVYIKDQSVKIMNMTDAFDIMGNAFTTSSSEGDETFVITNQGDIMGTGHSINKVQLGANAKANGNYSSAVGNLAKADGIESSAYGIRANATGHYSVAIGCNPYASRDGVAIGQGTKANGDYSVAVGSQAISDGIQSVASGYNANATGVDSVAVGSASSAIGALSSTIGKSAHASSSEGQAFGHKAKALAPASIAIGASSEASGSGSIALGLSAKTTGDSAVAIGRGVIAESNQFVLGTNTNHVIIPSTGLILTSPNKTRYRVKVSDSGVISTELYVY